MLLRGVENRGESVEKVSKNLDLRGRMRSDRRLYNYYILVTRFRSYTRYWGAPNFFCNLWWLYRAL